MAYSYRVREGFIKEYTAMVGAIFMSNTKTREQCFQMKIFGLPVGYQRFVNNVKTGMPLFLFDYQERKLYGVFRAACDGRLDIKPTAYCSTGSSYPAQVRFDVVWKCRPLREDEFCAAIEENYYFKQQKFYFDLSYEQVLRLFKLFDAKRVDRPVYTNSKKAELKPNCSSKETPDKCSPTPTIPLSVEPSHIAMPSSTQSYPVATQSYPSCDRYLFSSLISSEYKTQDPLHRVINYVPSTVNSYAPSNSWYSLSNPQNHANSYDHYGCSSSQCHVPTNEIYAPEHQQLSKGEALAPPTVNQEDIPLYPEVPECKTQLEDATRRQTEGFTDYILLPYFCEDFSNSQSNHGNGSSVLEESSEPKTDDIKTYKSDEACMKCNTWAGSNTIDPDKHPRGSVFSRLSVNQPSSTQETASPSVDQLVNALDQFVNSPYQRKNKAGTTLKSTANEDSKVPSSEQVNNAELNITTLLEAEESSQPPFVNFKRRKEVGKMDSYAVNEGNGKLKRRKLVRPSFGEDNGVSLEMDRRTDDGKGRNDGHLEFHVKRMEIDLNKPGCVDSDLMDCADNNVAYAADVNPQPEKPCKVSMNKQDSMNVAWAAIKELNSLLDNAPAEKVSPVLRL